MDDLINRQEAIDAVRTYLTDCQVEDADWHGNGIEHELNNLPSAQSDNTCNGCRYERFGNRVCYQCSRFYMDRYEVKHGE